MEVKLTLLEFEYLMENCEFAKKILTIKNKNFIKACVDINTAESIREWALNELEIKGFDENYELNSDGKILEALVDLFYV